MTIDPEGDARKAALLAKIACDSCRAKDKRHFTVDTNVTGTTRVFTVHCPECGRSATDASGVPVLTIPSAGMAAAGSG